MCVCVLIRSCTGRIQASLRSSHCLLGSDFIKTSTGKESVNATYPVAIVMVRAIRDYYLKTGHKVESMCHGYPKYFTCTRKPKEQDWSLPMRCVWCRLGLSQRGVFAQRRRPWCGWYWWKSSWVTSGSLLTCSAWEPAVCSETSNGR